MTVFVTKHEHIQISAVLQFPTSSPSLQKYTSHTCMHFCVLFTIQSFVQTNTIHIFTTQMYARTCACTHTHTHIPTRAHALIGRLSGFCSESSICNSKKLFGYRSQHICTQNSTYSQDLISFMIFLKPL